jgi:hypothetical protein
MTDNRIDMACGSNRDGNSIELFERLFKGARGRLMRPDILRGVDRIELHLRSAMLAWRVATRKLSGCAD